MTVTIALESSKIYFRCAFGTSVDKAGHARNVRAHEYSYPNF